jgi:hypothetical protein
MPPAGRGKPRLEQLAVRQSFGTAGASSRAPRWLGGAQSNAPSRSFPVAQRFLSFLFQAIVEFVGGFEFLLEFLAGEAGAQVLEGLFEAD